MLAVFGCKCKNAEPLARRVLQQAGILNYLSIPFYMGHKEAKKYVPLIQTADETSKRTLLSYILSSSGYSVVVGWNDEALEWSEVGSGRPIDISDGKIVAQRYS